MGPGPRRDPHTDALTRCDALHGQVVPTGGAEPVTIVILDAQALISDALAVLLERQPGLQVVAQTQDAEQTADVLEALEPAVLIVAGELADEQCCAVISRQRGRQRRLGVVVVAQDGHLDLLRSAMCSGANAFVFRGARSASLITAVRMAAAGERYLCTKALDILVAQWCGENSPPLEDRAVAQLSRREREIARLLAQGQSVKEIAALLEISHKTVETHRKNLMDKLEVESVVELVHFAIRNGMLVLEPEQRS